MSDMLENLDEVLGSAKSTRAARQTRAEAERPKVWQPASKWVF